MEKGGIMSSQRYENKNVLNPNTNEPATLHYLIKGKGMRRLCRLTYPRHLYPSKRTIFLARA